MADTSRVAVVILNYNGRSFLEQFLPGVLAHSSDSEVIVADNQSTDDSVEWMKENHPQVRLIINPKNGGFAQGYNVALQQVKAEYYVLLNSDVEVTPGWVEPLLDCMESAPSLGACQPKIKAFHQKNSFEYAGAAGGYMDSLGYPFCRGRIFDHLEQDHGQYDDSRPIFWATGACMMIRSELYHQLGGLDEDFFAHMEEIDMCWRMQHMGYQLQYVPHSTVFHVGGGTLNATSPFKTYLNFRNNLWLITKNLPTTQFVWKFPLRLILDGLAGLKFLVEGKGNHTRMIVKAHFNAYASLGKMWGKRKQFPPKTSPLVVKKWLFLQYFLMKKHTFSEIIPEKLP
ncbi:MAG TPA: dTDP-Rha--alpha-D-GlcNAc-pyrophosphate polyprenol alpha-3-L-rhamnosyltransferase [Cytophagales bacterium]|nr:dTDP-Rha--alpha-D-GlcNAc-pyrophosphate polyprenol alpha-3-L-rhamnosyltransferase [Cytophagales bacterium]HAP62961.1 dTDP-Rha--alpha-D-GlcNAc-pyrophosphate polyprenol alpha-3-L-rhamnosyltransferase [Cytophagales bacterium]